MSRRRPVSSTQSLVEARVSGTDANAAVRFLSELFRCSQLPVFIISMGEVPADNIAPHIFTREKDAMREFTRKWDQPGRELCFCLTTLKLGVTRHRAKPDLGELVALHADLDFRNINATSTWIERTIEALPLRPQLVVFIGRGLQCYWLLHEALTATPENVARIEAALRKLADVLAGDPSACICDPLMRLPGSHNTEAGSSIPVKVIKRRKGRHCLERIEAWLRTAKPVLQRYEHIRSAEQHYAFQKIIRDFRQSVESDRTATDRWADPTDLWADNDQLRRWAEAEEGDE